PGPAGCASAAGGATQSARHAGARLRHPHRCRARIRGIDRRQGPHRAAPGRTPRRRLRGLVGHRKTAPMIARALTLAATLYAVAASAFDNFDPVPGGIAGVTVAESGAAAPTAWFGSHRLPVLDLERGRVAVVGLDLDLAPGFYVVNVVDDEDHHDSRRFPVRPLARPIYTIEVPDEPPLAELVARHREALAVPGVAPAADGETPDLDFVLPVDLPIRFQFGRLNFGGTGLTA